MSVDFTTEAMLPPSTELPDNWEYGLQLPHSAQAPRIARSLTRTVLEAHALPDLVDTAALLISETVSNSYRYAGGPIAVRLHWNAATNRFRTNVWDDSPLHPACVLPAVDDTEGLGLKLLHHYADAWGTSLIGNVLCDGGGGKIVWFTLSAQPTA